MSKPKENKSLGIYFLQGALGVELSVEDVTKHKREYNKQYSSVAKMYGFKDFSTMFKYCMDNDNSLDFIEKATSINQRLTATSVAGGKSKRKDTSKLIRATKTTTRNGKTYSAPYWVDPNKDADTDNAKDLDTSANHEVVLSDGIYLGGKEFGKPLSSTKSNSKPPVSWSTVGKFRKSCFDYIFIISDNNIVFMAGLAEENNIVKIQYASACNDKLLLGNIFKLISKVIKESWLNGYGVEFDTEMFDKYVPITSLCELFKLKKRKNVYTATAKQLQDILGDSSWFHVLHS